MKRFLLSVVVCLFLGGPLCAAAQDRGYWHASSSSANSTTGDLTISDGKILINFVRFPIAQIRALQPTEINGVFASEDNEAATGNLYRLNIAPEVRFLHHNSLCGSEPTVWMVTSVAGKTLHVAFFSGANMPELTAAAIGNSTDLCGTFTYTR